MNASKVADLLKLDKSAARRRLQSAAAAGYVFNAEDQRGKPGRWMLGEPLPDGTRLLPVESTLATAPESETAGHDDGGLSGGTLAAESRGEDSTLGMTEVEGTFDDWLTELAPARLLDYDDPTRWTR